MTSGYLTDLADVARKAGLKVVEQPGWKTRGHGKFRAVDTVVCHHTAGPATGDMPSLGIITKGRSDLPGPLCNYGLGRNGTVYVIAAGYGYHAGTVRDPSYSNDHAIGIEAEATGRTGWPSVQMDAYAQLCAALCDHYGLSPSRVLGHKEVCAPRGRKSDPNFDMDQFRIRVRNAPGLDQEDDMPSPKDWTAEDWAAFNKNVTPSLARAVWAAQIKDGDGTTAAALLLKRADDDKAKS